VVQLPDVIYTDAVVTAAGSGGPLLNVAGEVVGVLIAASREPDVALAVDGLQSAVEEIIQAGQLRVPSLGAQTLSVTSSDVALSGGTIGAKIESVETGGPAQLAGLKAGDVITQLDDQKVDDRDPLTQVLRARFRAGQKVAVSYTRAGSTDQVQLTLTDERPTCQ
jgi:S1-C subfamily serine protease